MISFFVFELRENLCGDLVSSDAKLSLYKKQFKKAIVNPSALLLCTSKRSNVWRSSKERFLVNSFTVFGLP